MFIQSQTRLGPRATSLQTVAYPLVSLMLLGETNIWCYSGASHGAEVAPIELICEKLSYRQSQVSQRNKNLFLTQTDLSLLAA